MPIETIDKRERLRLLREFHINTFKDLGIPDAVFIPKLAYAPAGKTERVIGLFPSEVAKGQDVYIEFADSDNQPQDPERRLYKWKFNPHYKEEYEQVEKNGIVRYMIPVAELILVKSNSPELLLKTYEEPPKEVVHEVSEDIQLSQMTIRDFASILWKRPVSNKKWLNILIEKNQ